MNADGSSPFHVGELAVQERVGVRERIAPFAKRGIRPAMPDQHREFFAALPFIVLSARDAAGRPWASVVDGDVGFLASPVPDRLDMSGAPARGDALHGALRPGSAVGLLGIEFDTRRRNRMNGTIASAGASGVEIRVDQSFGNCPQYISTRDWRRVSVTAGDGRRASSLDTSMTRWIEHADTAFIASGVGPGIASGAAAGMDVSHRGGPQGFVEVESPTRLIVPDYAGNDFFNTLGNLIEDPSIGLTFVDFDSGSLLQISGRATIDWAPADPARHPGARRLLAIDIEAVVQATGILGLRWSEPRASVRQLKVARRHVESADVVSFELVPRDGGDVVPFRAGQHLPVMFRTADGSELERSYSLTNAEDDPHYRIAVKRREDGLVSGLLHEGGMLEGGLLAGRPSGEFGLPDGNDPVVLTSAGIGITPMLALLRAAARDGRQVDFIHVARDGQHHPFADEVRDLAAGSPTVRVHVAYSRPGEHDRLGIDHHSSGRLDASDPSALPTPASAHHFVCGPPAFVASVSEALEARGVDPRRVHVESF